MRPAIQKTRITFLDFAALCFSLATDQPLTVSVTFERLVTAPTIPVRPLVIFSYRYASSTFDSFVALSSFSEGSKDFNSPLAQKSARMEGLLVAGDDASAIGSLLLAVCFMRIFCLSSAGGETIVDVCERLTLRLGTSCAGCEVIAGEEDRPNAVPSATAGRLNWSLSSAIDLFIFFGSSPVSEKPGGTGTSAIGTMLDL